MITLVIRPITENTESSLQHHLLLRPLSPPGTPPRGCEKYNFYNVNSKKITQILSCDALVADLLWKRGYIRHWALQVFPFDRCMVLEKAVGVQGSFFFLPKIFKLNRSPFFIWCYFSGLFFSFFVSMPKSSMVLRT